MAPVTLHELLNALQYRITLRKETEAYKNKTNFSQNCVGIHIRRSDKIIKEAKLYKLGDYMEKVALYYNNNPVLARYTEKCIVLITDEIGLVEETKR